MLRGTSQDQDGRFKDKEELLLSETEFPSLYKDAVSEKKVNLRSALWAELIDRRVTALLDYQDELVCNY